MNFLISQSVTIDLAVEDLPPLADLEAVWRDLEVRADGSFFTSWTWIGAWLATRGELAADTALVVARAGDLVVGLAIVGRAEQSSLFGPRTVVALNQSGVPKDDAIYIEYNDILLDRRYAAMTRRLMLSFMARDEGAWHEMRLSGVTPVVATCVAAIGAPHRVIAARACPWVDLTKVPPTLSGYLAVVSRNTRQQIQRSLRLYEGEGALTLATAQTHAEIEEFMSDLRLLHETGWRERKSQAGAFAAERFVKFVNAIVPTGVADGSVQLMRVKAGEAVVGCLLNFIHRGHVYAYQSGFAYRDDNRYRPGLVTHVLAIARAREQGARGYHFMAGEGRYKTSLANADEKLFWMALRQDDWRTRAEDAARTLKHAALSVLRSFRHEDRR